MPRLTAHVWFGGTFPAARLPKAGLDPAWFAGTNSSMKDEPLALPVQLSSPLAQPFPQMCHTSAVANYHSTRGNTSSPSLRMYFEMLSLYGMAASCDFVGWMSSMGACVPISFVVGGLGLSAW